MSRKTYLFLSTLLIFAFALTACGAPAATQAPAATEAPPRTSIAMRQLKIADSPPPSAIPSPPPAMTITCWIENAFPRRSGG